MTKTSFSKPERVVIHGGGYVGLTAAVHYALEGIEAIIFDPDPFTVESINSANPRAGDFLSYLQTDVKKLVDQKQLWATSDFHKISSLPVHSIAVPTEKNGEPYDDIVSNALLNLAASVPDNSTILIESTLTPGFMDEFLPKLKQELGDKKIGENIYISVCPRRDWFADPKKNLKNLVRVVGGVTDTCTEKAVSIISNVSDHIEKTTYQTAEICKALENALLHVPVMFAHQLAYSLPDRNVAEALRLASTHWRLMNLNIGFGTGGRCVPLGTKYLARAAKGKLTIGEEALDFDNEMRSLVARSIAQKFPGGRVCILGIGYRPEFKDAGLSPGLEIAIRMKKMGLDVGVWDPLWSDEELSELTNLPVRKPSNQDKAILLATPHKNFVTLPNDNNIWKSGQFVLDGQGAWIEHKTNFEDKGIIYKQVGMSGWL